MHIRKKWLEFCNFGENFAVKTSTYLCSKHFTEKDYLLTATNRILMSGSIPSIYHVKKRKRYVHKKINCIIQNKLFGLVIFLVIYKYILYKYIL